MVIETAFADRDHSRMRRCFDQRRCTEVRMRVGFVGMDANRCPNVDIALGGSEHLAPLALSRRNVEETRDAPCPRIRKNFVLALGKARIVEMAVAIDEPHLAASWASSSSSSLGNNGCGCPIGWPSRPLSISVSS